MEEISCTRRLALTFMLLTITAGSMAKEYALLEEKRVIAVAGRDRRIILSCPYTRRIPVVWRKNGKVVYDSRNTRLSYGTITIRPVILNVEGLYECRSEDLYDNGYRAVFNVSVNESPRILKRNKRHSYVNGSSADFLNCKANGKPKPDVFWINEKGFSPINPPTITRISETTLKVSNLKNGDSRILICVAQNVHGRVKVTFKVGSETKAAVMPNEQKETKKILSTTPFRTTQKTTTERPGRPPWFTSRPSRITYARLGGKLIVKCSADGEPKPAIVISKIRPNGFKLLGNKIAIVKGIHLGIYECKAVNKHGTIKYPFLIKIRGGRRRIHSYKKKMKIYNPYAASFSQWSQWSRCSTSCGMGFQIRTRKCIAKLARLRARLCHGRTKMRRSCYQRHC